MGPKKKGKSRKAFYNKMPIFDMFAISQILLGRVFSGNINPPGGLPGTNPRFLETQISSTSQGLKTSCLFFVSFLKFVARSSNSVALTFRCGSDGNGPGIHCWEL